MKRILIIDDDSTFRVMLKTFLLKLNYDTEVASTGWEGLKLLAKGSYDLILIDFRLPDKNGLDLLSEIKASAPHTPLILMTSYVDIKTAVKAIKSGAFEYVTKPINTDEIILTIKNALASGSTPSIIQKLNNEFLFIKGESDKADIINKHIDLVAPTTISVIIEGESGTGKEYVSKMIHNKSKRSSKPFIAIDCGALNIDLAASELFGHIKGAFTGASHDKTGYFEYASGGTLFLDEIGNLSYDIQIKLLRAIQERKIRKVGSNTDIDADVRIIAATNEDLSDLVKKGFFREDLYHRLNEFKIQIPPLRNRGNDITVYAHYFLETCSRELEKTNAGFNKDVIECFLQHQWLGNLRELKNVIRRAVLLTANGEPIGKEVLPEEIQLQTHSFLNQTREENMVQDLKLFSERNEREIISATLHQVRYNKSKAAKILNIDRKTLYNKLRTYGMDDVNHLN